jgi:hypothetical protein
MPSVLDPACPQRRALRAQVRLTVCEIYCERVRDLLDPLGRDNLAIKQGRDGSTFVEGRSGSVGGGVRS